MILYDGVIYKLQQSGGVSVLFNELIQRLPPESYRVECEDLKYPWQRYMAFPVKAPYDIFHSTYYRVPSRKHGAVVATVHDFTYERYVKGPRRWVHTLQKLRSVASADRIICVSESTKRDLLEFFGHQYEARIVVVHNGVSENYFPVAGTPRCAQLLFVGARGGYKNFSAVAAAISPLRDLELLCVGGGAFTRDEVEFLERTLPGRYRHAGFLSNEALNLEYNRSLALVYPSLYEGFGIPVLEAMRAGCPVIAVRSSSIPEVAGEAALLLDTGEVEDIRWAVERVLDPVHWGELSRKGQEQASRFSWDVTYRNTLEVYEDILGRSLTHD
ncbi:glycosyltransferase family 4 protein [Pseudomonas sp. gcc21]|uniref:glycosyltransferase family 4 protein n=1 Tax=Pseudomonas sp. gcc21 TaxID=2726989 RepID=UPI0014511A83|nr:glycosyltransferase family 1 protein [Pseudomonas sp. gcc21]QJD58659.1 glycosyltransferase family 4 protein [Pseudomonas sp. gcc21]